MRLTEGSGLKRIFDGSRLFDCDLSIEYRIMSIIAYTAAVGNTVGFLANFMLYGMSIPTAFCGFCDILALFYLAFGLKQNRYLFNGYILLFILNILEFPLLVLAYGAVMYPYVVMGFMATVMLTTGKKRWIISVLLLVYDLVIIVISHIRPFIFGEQEVSGLIGSALITFTVALTALSFCTITWQNVYLRNTLETDGITGKLSRDGFFRKAGKLLHNAAPDRYTLLYFDILGFKAINTVYGTEEGNRLLKSLAEDIGEAFFSPYLVGRLTADRFIALVDSAKLDEHSLRRFCRYQYRSGIKSVSVTLNCGAYPIHDPDEDIGVICDKAQSIIRHIRVGQNKSVALYDREMAKSFREETGISEDIEKALLNRDFEPFYQPIVDCRTGRVVSAEALARWTHPDKGVISPGTFIPILEKKEKISDLDEIMISKVDRFLNYRLEQEKSVVPISVNLSRVDLFNPDFTGNIGGMIRKHPEYKGLIRFEVTESALISLPDTVFDLLSDFRKAGAAIMIDDFGNGYSSLGMLTDFTFDLIKLDKAFTDRIEDSERNREVIKAMIDLAHSFKEKIICEGVENEKQLDFLKSCGCDYIQGYYYFQPMRESKFIELLDYQEKIR